MERLTKRHGKHAVQIGAETRRNDPGWDRLADLEDMAESDGWIPVTEQPPEYDGEYFVCFSDGFMTTVTYSTDHDGNQDWELWADSGEVIAWMPLPGPYREADHD